MQLQFSFKIPLKRLCARLSMILLSSTMMSSSIAIPSRSLAANFNLGRKPCTTQFMGEKKPWTPGTGSQEWGKDANLMTNTQAIPEFSSALALVLIGGIIISLYRRKFKKEQQVS
ncbi:MAG: hypothetical protein SFW36_00075 [Leptolyngbyaceae cyanobacterium bins.59]|nr:hypothetical protein [Leptolyngbyaceae cyanobacterium bins.59]